MPAFRAVCMGKAKRHIVKPQPSGSLEALGVICLPFVAFLVLILVYTQLGIFIGACGTFALIAVVSIAYVRQYRVKWTCSFCGHTLAGPVRIRVKVELPAKCPNCRELFENRQ